MKDELIARKIRRIIQKDVTNFFNSKLEIFNKDIESLISCEESVNEIDQYLHEKELEAIEILRRYHDITFDKFSFERKRKIIRQVEDRIFIS